MTKERYQIQGMTCGGCARSLINALKTAGLAIDPKDVSVEHGTFMVESGHPAELLRETISKAGFRLGERLS